MLAPMYRGAAEIDRLNEMLQAIFNPNDTGTRKELAFGEIKYRIGDKILQLVNQPEQHIFNGISERLFQSFMQKRIQKSKIYDYFF